MAARRTGHGILRQNARGRETRSVARRPIRLPGLGSPLRRVRCTSCIRRRRTSSVGPMPSCSSQHSRRVRAETPSAAQISAIRRYRSSSVCSKASKRERDVLAFTRGGRSLDRRAIREALDQGIDQLLLQPVRGFGADKRVRPTFDRADGSRMEVAQVPAHRRSRAPPPGGGTGRRRRLRSTCCHAEPAPRPAPRSSSSGRAPRFARCRRWPTPGSNLIPPAPILIPPEIGAGLLPLGSETRTTVGRRRDKRAIRGRCSSAADSRRRCSATWVSRALNSPCPVTSRPRPPSSRKAASKSSGSLNTDVTLPGISWSRWRSGRFRFDQEDQEGGSTRLFTFGISAGRPATFSKSLLFGLLRRVKFVDRAK